MDEWISVKPALASGLEGIQVEIDKLMDKILIKSHTLDNETIAT